LLANFNDNSVEINDVLLLIDLLNGAGVFDDEANLKDWITVSEASYTIGVVKNEAT